MAQIASFRDLLAWQKAIELAEGAYVVAGKLPRHEQFNLGAQIRRAALSVPSNIAEGQRRTTAGFLDFLRIALGSVAELETQLDLAGRVGYLARGEADQAIAQAEEVSRIIRGLMAGLRRHRQSRATQ
jgi:four helix bundle protein